jgi:hypothetical protein
MNVQQAWQLKTEAWALIERLTVAKHDAVVRGDSATVWRIQAIVRRLAIARWQRRQDAWAALQVPVVR